MLRYVLSVLIIILSWGSVSSVMANSENVSNSHQEYINPRLGESAWLIFQSGAILPMLDLKDVIDRDANFLLGIRVSYWSNFWIRFSADYSNLNSTPADMHYAVGKVGFDWVVPSTFGAELGLGLGLFFLRASEIRETISFADNESDYGTYFRVQSPALTFKKFDLSVETMWDIVWTLPSRSHFLRVGLNARYKLW